MAIFVFSAAQDNPVAAHHYNLSVANGFPLNQLVPFIDVRTRAQLTLAYPEDRAFFWAGKSEGKDEQSWDRMTPGDLILIYGGRSIYAAAFIVATARSAALGDNVWGRDGERSYDLIYFFSEPIRFPARSIEQLNADEERLGQIYQGLRRLPDEKYERIIRAFGSEHRFLEVALAQRAVHATQYFAGELPAPNAAAEGGRVPILASRFERDPQLRRDCIAHYGAICAVCGFNFGERYPAIGEGFIEVHHLNELNLIGQEHLVHPINDLRPVCPNCHAMLHTKRPAWTIEELQQMLR